MNSLIEYHNKLWKESRTEIKHFLLHREQSSLHHFRVNVKKLNAISRLLSFVDEKSESFRSLKGINKMFEYAGELRDGYVIEELSKKYGIEDLLSKEDRERQEEHFEKLKKCYRGNNSHGPYIRLKNIKNLEKVSENNVILYIEHIRNQIEQSISSLERPRDIHQIRKIIKDFLFISTLLNLKSFNNEIEAFEELQHDIGNKHDLEKLLKKLYWQKKGLRMRKAIVKVKKDEEILESKILSSFKNIF